MPILVIVAWVYFLLNVFAALLSCACMFAVGQWLLASIVHMSVAGRIRVPFGIAPQAILL